MVNEETLALIQRWEGLVLYAYDDQDRTNPRRFIRPGDPVKGVLTIGYGHTLTVQPGMRIDGDRATALLRQDLMAAERAVDVLVQVPLTDNQRGALVAFVFNVGEDAFRGSTLRRKLNAGDYASVPAQLARWNKDNGRVVEGLVNRRAAEAGLWARGSFVSSNTAPVTAPKEAMPAPVHAAGGLALGGVATWAVENASGVLSPLASLDWRVGALIVVALAIAAGVWAWKRSAPA